MFIAGTRTRGQWALNLLDLVTHEANKHIDEISEATEIPFNMVPLGFRNLDPWRESKREYLERIAKENGVQVIYGHSRGGAILADMNTNPDVQKVGLDSAMIISENKDMLNLNEYKRGSLNPYDYFDGLIGFGGKKNVTVNLGDNMHHAWN